MTGKRPTLVLGALGLLGHAVVRACVERGLELGVVDDELAGLVRRDPEVGEGTVVEV